jgi:hypothetical protein
MKKFIINCFIALLTSFMVVGCDSSGMGIEMDNGVGDFSMLVRVEDLKEGNNTVEDMKPISSSSSSFVSSSSSSFVSSSSFALSSSSFSEYATYSSNQIGIYNSSVYTKPSVSSSSSSSLMIQSSSIKSSEAVLVFPYSSSVYTKQSSSSSSIASSSSSIAQTKEMLKLNTPTTVYSGDILNVLSSDTVIEVTHTIDNNSKVIVLLSGSAELLRGDYYMKNIKK